MKNKAIEANQILYITEIPTGSLIVEREEISLVIFHNNDFSKYSYCTKLLTVFHKHYNKFEFLIKTYSSNVYVCVPPAIILTPQPTGRPQNKPKKAANGNSG
jgi:hypothetical protein